MALYPNFISFTMQEARSCHMEHHMLVKSNSKQIVVTNDNGFKWVQFAETGIFIGVKYWSLWL